MVTIFTPVYNRADTINQLFHSLLRQTNYNFEWLIIDDGSQDQIAEIVSKWIDQKEIPFSIRFYQQNNGGKHRAINRGVELAKGEAFFIVDSDDYLTIDAVETIYKWWKSVEEDDAFAGIAGLIRNKKGEIIGGEPLFNDFIDATNFERAQYNLLGDKAEVYKTSVLKKYPFPEIDGENFLTEAVVWDRIAYDGLKIRWLDQVIYICEYREDGLTHQGQSKFINNPIGWALYIRQQCEFFHMTTAERLYQYAVYTAGVENRMNCQQIKDNLGISEKELMEVEHCYQNCVKNTHEQIGEKIAVYGVGARGKALLMFYRHSDVEISFVLDRNRADVPYRQIDLDGKYPCVDAIIVTPQSGQDEIISFLSQRTDDRIISYEEWGKCIGLWGKHKD
ncbi:MAG: glycosyltransferase family 2 protein [Lachnospiraceae bacterium]|nr:glycosyltransferase family 2 protein [Lachnospiraceae bacterium]